MPGLPLCQEARERLDLAPPEAARSFVWCSAQHLPSRIDRPIIFVSRIWGAITKKQFEKPLEESAIGESHTI